MKQAARPAITTTLYDLIAALHAQVGLEDDKVITAFVVHLLRTGQITFPGKLSTYHGRVKNHDDWHLNEASSVFPSHLEPQPASSIDPWEKPQALSGLAEGARGVRA